MLSVALFIPTTTLSIETKSTNSPHTLTVENIDEQKLHKIQKAIEENNATWTAGYTTVFGPAAEFKPSTHGVIDEKLSDDKYTVIEFSGPLPSEWDWRNVDGKNWMTSVKNQGSCGSCTAFGTLSALEAVVQIEQDVIVDCDLSEAFLFNCGGGSCDTGMALSDASQFISSTGVPDELCFPYKASDMPCDAKANNWNKRVIKASHGTVSRSAIKEALITYGPVVTAFDVYEDFNAYKGGVYEYVWGAYEAGHAVAIVGYKDDTSMDSKGYWICKNSWSKGWGEDGYFKIKYDNCGIGKEGYYFQKITGNIPPSTPIASNPSDGTPNIERTVNLSWTPSHDVDGEKVYYIVYLSEGRTAHDSDKIADRIITPFLTVTQLKYDTIYSWKVIAEDELGSQSGGENWMFGTRTPNKPILNGTDEGKIKTDYTYTALAPDTDSDGHYYYWFFDWGDDTNSGWIGPYGSENQVNIQHSWAKKNGYTLKVAYKIDDVLSEWATLPISMQKTYTSNPNILMKLLQRYLQSFVNYN